MYPNRTSNPQSRRPSVALTAVFGGLLNAALWMLIIKLIYFSISLEVLAVIVIGIFGLSVLGLCMFQVAQPKPEIASDRASSAITKAADLSVAQRRSEATTGSPI